MDDKAPQLFHGACHASGKRSGHASGEAVSEESLWLERGDGHRLACRRRRGASPGIVFLGGYASDMTGTKATFLDGWCRRRGQAFLRFDYLGHGQSSGAFADGTIGRWSDDALACLDRLTAGPQILVGSSMGGWIMLDLALKRPRRLAGLVGIAAAPDFSQDLWWAMTPDERRRLAARGAIEIDGDGGRHVVTRALVEDGRRHLLLRGPIDLPMPVRLLHGMEDASVPWSTAIDIADRLSGGDVAVTLVKDGDHRLSRPRDLERLGLALEELCASSAAGAPSCPERSAAASAASPSRQEG